MPLSALVSKSVGGVPRPFVQQLLSYPRMKHLISYITFAAVVGDGFIAQDIAFRNTAGAANHQAVALRSGSDQSVFYRCSFEGYQDTLVIGKSRGQLVQILYPKCNQQLDSWECGFYVRCWIKTIIRAIITNDWNERFKSTSPIPEDTIRQIRQEWTLLIFCKDGVRNSFICC
ncbi:hypothetical protein LR48_Vigan11g062200 [Vigna angularis]|uniref:Pectinesterase catalytic domain-containing protein n=1 Tax=Phaseolus angularis TaxID=3914 RepID=A0A0L9VS70_PHAAN|nr:hypothetical protein LR48_Vigan11g062200 [Vigna angularis]